MSELRKKDYDLKPAMFRFFYRYDYHKTNELALRLPFFVPLVIIAVVGGLFTLIYGGCALANHIDAPRTQSSIIQMQKDLHVLDICDVDTRNDFIRCNTTVRRSQRYNSIWFFDLAIADSWDKMKVVPLPSTTCYKETERKDYNLNISGIEAINIEAKKP